MSVCVCKKFRSTVINVLGNSLALAFILTVLGSTLPSITFAQQVCQSTDSDSDGDGWGWENNRSCIVSPETGTIERVRRASDFERITDSNGRTICQSPDSDPDGDGFGWENSATCIVAGSNLETTAPTQAPASSHPPCTSSAVDPDGDGFGWENNATCLVENRDSSSNSATENDTDVRNDSNDNTRFSAEDITDLILITGQSNTLGSNTTWNDTLDAPHPRVFAYTSEGWQVAELFQVWDNRVHPGTGNRNDVDSIHNNFALHFGKRLAELDDNIVVGFVLVSEPGRGIRHWAPGAPGKQRVKQKALQAINALPSKTAVDGILWHQGETDFILEGTSDRDAPQPAPANYYPVRLSALIEDLRQENWFDESSPFICGETINAEGVNTHLGRLNTDNDPATACVAAAGLPSISPGGNHFNASALRTLGRRYAEAYHRIR